MRGNIFSKKTRVTVATVGGAVLALGYGVSKLLIWVDERAIERGQLMAQARELEHAKAEGRERRYIEQKYIEQLRAYQSAIAERDYRISQLEAQLSQETARAKAAEAEYAEAAKKMVSKALG